VKRTTAWVFYVVGGVLALKSAVWGLAGGSLYASFTGIAFGIAVWWIVVGIGVRLGVTPDDFVASIKAALGFGEPFQTPAERREVTEN
jgi:hypothetical protein